MSLVALPASAFPPPAVGFFGLATGYLIDGPQEFFGFPKGDAPVNLAMGVWGIWMPGFRQFLTGTYILVGLAWLHTLTAGPLYMAGLAFSACGMHWFAIGYNRAKGAGSRPNGFMAVLFSFISLMGLIVFYHAGDWPVGTLFLGLLLIYSTDIFANFKLGGRLSEQALGLLHMVVGLGLTYLMFGVTLNFALGFHLTA